MNRILILIVTAFLGTSAYSQEHLKHTKWTALLEKHVDDDGNVDYAGFKKEEKF